MIENDKALLNAMMQDLKKSESWYQPTNYWKVYQDRLMPVINENGISQFRGSESKIFNSFGVTQPPHTLVGEFLEVHDIKGSIIGHLVLSFLRKIRLYKIVISQHRKTYAAFLNACFHIAAGETSKQELLTISDSGLAEPRDLFQPLASHKNRYTLAFLRYYLQYRWVKKRIDFSGVKTICELGTGYGGQIEVIRKLHPNIKFLVCDIPPQLYIAEQYLKSVFPGDVTGYMETSAMDKINLMNTKSITIIGTWQLTKVESPIDLFISSTTFQEMEPDIVDNYFKIIKSFTKQHIYLMQLVKGQKLASEIGKHGVLKPTTLEHYEKFLNEEFKLRETEEATLFSSGQIGTQFLKTDIESHHNMLFDRR
ncbi:MAG: putative sugar O-methyltransferase [Magnetococcales bacterium]|nr:putative sugar O-methyltransferase [Magnetococcales bacterium]